MQAFTAPSFAGPSLARSLLPPPQHARLTPKRLCPRPAGAAPPCRRASAPAAMTASHPRNIPVVPAIVVVDHGSRRAAANEMLADVAQMVRRRSDGIPVHAAHMELAAPSIADAFAAAVAGGATHVIVVPFFLSPGRHVTSDIPRLAEEAARAHAGVSYDVRPPIGTHPAIADVIMERAGAGVPVEGDAVLR